MQVTLTKAQHRAVNALRGLPAGAHMLVMCSSSTESGGILDGNSNDFDELVSHINEELADGTISASASRTLAAVCVKIDPSSADWLGM